MEVKELSALAYKGERIDESMGCDDYHPLDVFFTALGSIYVLSAFFSMVNSQPLEVAVAYAIGNPITAGFALSILTAGAASYIVYRVTEPSYEIVKSLDTSKSLRKERRESQDTNASDLSYSDNSGNESDDSIGKVPVGVSVFEDEHENVDGFSIVLMNRENDKPVASFTEDFSRTLRHFQKNSKALAQSFQKVKNNEVDLTQVWTRRINRFREDLREGRVPIGRLSEELKGALTCKETAFKAENEAYERYVKSGYSEKEKEDHRLSKECYFAALEEWERLVLMEPLPGTAEMIKQCPDAMVATPIHTCKHPPISFEYVHDGMLHTYSSYN